MSNLYFAYSIKKEYTSPPLGHPAISTPSGNRKKHIRACDACAVRKTKCEETRPCRNCRNNGLECTELRQRKKMGPKTLRKRTIESIHSLERRSSGDKSPDLAGVAEAVSSMKREAVEAVFPLVAPSMVDSLDEVVKVIVGGVANGGESGKSSGSESAANGDGPGQRFDPQARAKELAYNSFGLLLLSSSSTPNLDDFRDHVASLYGAFGSMSLSSQNYTSATHYYMSLTELHMYGILLFQGTPFCVRQLVHLRSAITHYQLIATSSDSDISGLSELRRILYTVERNTALFAIEEAFKSGCLINTGPSSPFMSNPNSKTLVLDCAHDIFKLLEEHGVYTRISSLPNLFLWRYVTFSNQTGVYGSVKMNAQNVTQAGAQTPFVQLLVALISFKVLVLHAGEYTPITVSNELLEFITRAIIALIAAKTDPYFTTRLTAFSLVPHLLDLLRCYFESVSNAPPPDAVDRLREYAHLIFPLCAKSSYMGAAKLDPVLSGWFSREFSDWESSAPSSAST
ncbi:hypothetical protein CA3LBN_001957 [Candidozyma haemuli]|uniref:Zn(2)-C6 fungal-type domain-containing protein n=2 Tax=Candidozyma TaxID=3303203 RepID=A0ABX8I3L2_9ASCO|nr:hypothetical protein CA3LBN_001957 [[Candida] haemuloni]